MVDGPRIEFPRTSFHRPNGDKLRFLDRLPSELRERAIPLDGCGVNSVAWMPQDVAAVLDALRRDGISVLGGDVYSIHGGGVTLTYDNWCCERMPDEARQDFVARSHADAVRYVRRHACSNAGEFVYELVIED